MERARTESRHRMPFSGDRMRKVRKAKRIKQAQLAGLIRTTQKMISQYERGIYQPNASTLDAIANALDCSLDYLFARTDELELGLSRDEREIIAALRSGRVKVVPNIVNQTILNDPINRQ